MVWPARVIVVGAAVLFRDRAAWVIALTVAVDWLEVTALPCGSRPDAVAALLIEPLSRSASCVV